MNEEITLPEGWEEVTQSTPQRNSSTQLPQGWSEVIGDKSSGMPPTVTDTPTGITKYDLNKAAESIAAIESSGNYNAVGQPVKGKRAYGKYQIMEQNIPQWSQEILGKPVTLEEFKSSPELQDKIAKGKMEQYFNKGYSPQDVASIWLSGKPMQGNNRKDLAAGVSVPEYVQKFNEFYGNPKAIKLKQENPQIWKAAEWLDKSPAAKTAVNFVNALGDIAGGIGLGTVESAAKGFSSIGNLGVDAANLVSGSNIPRISSNDIIGGIQKGATGFGNAAISLGNFLNNTNIPKLNQPQGQEIIPQSGYGDAGKFVGNVIGQGAVGGVAYKSMGAIPKLKNEASILANIIRGMGAGAATGEEGFGGRLGSALVGGALSPVSQLTNKAIADRVLKSADKEKSIASKGFNDVFEKSPKDSIVIPEENIDFNLIRKSIPNKERIAFDEYLQEPTIENAHRAQSLLGREIRDLNNEIINQGKSIGRVKRLNELTNAQDSIKKALSKQLKGKKGLNEKYVSEKKNYKENVVPYETKDLRLYKAGKKSPKNLVQKLSKDYEFMQSKAGKKHGSSINTKKFIDSVMNKSTIKGAGMLGLGGLGLYEGKKTYDKYNDN